MRKPLVTIVLPAFNEEANLPELYRRLTSAVAQLDRYAFEFLLIDNCSTDGTQALALQFVEQDPRWRYICFSRNFGFEISLAAGLHYSRGDALIFMVTDLQDPPELLPTMISKWEEGYQVVYGELQKRSDNGFLKSLGAHAAYWLIHRLSDIRIPPNATDFRLLTRPVIDALIRCGEQNRYARGLVHWVGFRQIGFPYDRAERKAGKSTANLLYCVKFAFAAVIAFSSKPLRIATYIGLLSTIASIAGAVVYTAMYVLVKLGSLHLTPSPPGWMTQLLVILFFCGMQSLFMGLLGEYLANVYQEVKRRPLWVIGQTAGFEDLGWRTSVLRERPEVERRWT